MDARREAVTDRLRARDDERKKLEEVRRGETEGLERQVDRFACKFGSIRTCIDALLLQSGDQAVSGNLPGHFDCIASELQSAQKLISDAQLFLPTYDKWASNRDLASLQSKFDEQKAALVPKKKFAFKSRKKEIVLSSGDEPDSKGGSESVAISVDAPSKHSVSFATDCGFFDQSSVVLTKSASEVNGKDVTFHRLIACTVRVHGNPSTVHASGLVDCTVLIGPVSTSVFLHDCVRVTLAVACQQLRVHASRDCDFYVQVSSRSVIENCSGIRFAPFNWRYDGIEEHFTSSGINSGVKNWMAVDDFDWLVAETPSPNWSVLEEDQRVTVHCGSP